MSNASFPRVGLFLRLAAIIYDLLVVAGVMMFAAALALGVSALLHAIGWWPLAAEQDHASRLMVSWVYRAYLVMVLVGFYSLFWSKGGQTLGMKAWRLRVQNTDNQAISFRQAVLRFFFSFAGLGNFWVLFNKEKLALQDILAKCEVVRLSQEANQFKNWRQPAVKK
ncbi:hypothetical protein CWE15_09310 [Aliidiomarina taiwanensis]|uniref:RDD domain-containing protein n=1 Tax=Aliidiomarina taiwanensis TaxID=946228 RepID=A0A432WZW6_9GAMM|nr:RDD family protein [Aliidiomarina taiwanensis]RUO39314.1 hypothetical protein CWE15_09310 [Aliidiomarina taiwanensis]